MQHIKDNILQAADKVFETEKWTDCFILDIILNDKKVEIYADTDEGIKFWQCQKLSRGIEAYLDESQVCLLYTSPSPRDQRGSRMPSSA